MKATSLPIQPETQFSRGAWLTLATAIALLVYSIAVLAYRFTLGGPFRLGAFAPDAFRGRHFAYGGLGYLLSIGRLPDFVGGPIRLAAEVEVGSAFDEVSSARLKGCLTGGAELDTVLGPVFAGMSLGNRGAFSFYVSVGRLLR